MKMKYLTAITIIGMTGLAGLAQGDAIQHSVVPTTCKNPGDFAMTFVQGPCMLTGEILDACDDLNVKLTFHPEADHLESDAPSLAHLKRAAQDGHTIGLFISANYNLNEMSRDEMLETIQSRRKLIAFHIGYEPMFLRVGIPLCRERVQELKELGIYVTGASIDSYDYKATDPKQILSQFMVFLDTMSGKTRGSFISVQNEFAPHTPKATKDILEYIISKGYNIVTLDVCLGIKNSNKGSGSISQGNTTTTTTKLRGASQTGDAAGPIQGGSTAFALALVASVAMFAIL